MPKVTIYIRNHQTREYELADPKTIYPDGTIWVLRYKQGGRRKWETLSDKSHAPGCGPGQDHGCGGCLHQRPLP